MRLSSACVCGVLVIFSIILIYITWTGSHWSTLRLSDEATVEFNDDACILWVLSIPADSLSQTKMENVKFYHQTINASQKMHKFVAVTNENIDICREKFGDSASLLHVIPDDVYSLAASHVKEKELVWMKSLLLLPHLTSIANQTSCSHLGLLPRNSCTYNNLTQIRCSALADIFRVMCAAKPCGSAVGFNVDKVQYLVSMLVDMVHIANLDERFERLWHMFVHCNAVPELRIQCNRLSEKDNPQQGRYSPRGHDNSAAT